MTVGALAVGKNGSTKLVQIKKPVQNGAGLRAMMKS